MFESRVRLPTGKVTFDEQYSPVGVTSTSSHRDLRDRVWVNGFTAVVPLADLEGPERRPDRSQSYRTVLRHIEADPLSFDGDCVWSDQSAGTFLPDLPRRCARERDPRSRRSHVDLLVLLLLLALLTTLSSSSFLSLSRRCFFPFLPRPDHLRLLLKRGCSISWLSVMRITRLSR